jgi:peptidoglycan hydrolase-like protein with peptidoglycan-binding domain
MSMFALTGCGSNEDGSAAVRVAEARVSAAERSLTNAKADAADASAQFCDASATYITALDRYGDVLSQTAPTVGDVVDAGSDLEQPSEEVAAQAEAAVAAHEALGDARQKLAEAEATLAAATSPRSPTPSAPDSSTPKPLAPPASVNRVRQAEAEFTAAQQGITDQTPLSLAVEQFNAAAVALEMSWLGLFSDAGCLSDEQQAQADAVVRSYATTLQTALRDAGYYDGEVDGVYGPTTVDAVEALQQTHGLPRTGTVDKATADALVDDLAAQDGAIAQEAVASTAAVQQTLKLAGFWDGPVDGEWTPALTEALMDFQADLGVEPTGTVDAATVAALEEAIAAASSESPTPSTSSSVTPSATPSSSPSSSNTTGPTSE